VKLSLLVALILGACAPAVVATGASQPMRPKPKTLEPPPPPVTYGPPTDCAPVAGRTGGEAIPFKAQRRGEAEALASDGLAALISSEDPQDPGGAPHDQYISRFETAVEKFLLALELDPYNVKATYNLAAAYARLGRKECALNLIDRLNEMRAFPSRKKDVDDAFFRLFGSGGKWKGKPDPDFDLLRNHPRFTQVTGKSP
jgi:hypothetical protein